MTRRAVILTPSGDAGPYEQVVKARGFDPVIEPMLSVVPASAPLPDLSPYTALAFTSIHAVHAFAQQSTRRDAVVFTVGDSTADAARAAGFTNVRSASGTAADLERLIAGEDKARILYVRGEDVAHALGGVESHIIYTAYPVEKLTSFCEGLMREGCVEAAAFFSPRGGEIFTRLVRECGLEGPVSGIKALCLSKAVLESVSILPWRETRIAARPDRAAMIALLDE